MKDDVLGKILYIEKEIKQKLDVEKKRAADWLKKVREDSEKEILTEKNRLQDPFDKAVKTAQLDAEKKALEIVRKAQIKARILESLSDETLNKIISKHINCILPGE